MESGAPKGSLYFHFPGGKDQLVVEATQYTVGRITANLLETLRTTTSPALAVRAYFEATAEALVASDFAFGCPIAPLVLDGIADLQDVALVCRTAFREWADILEQNFISAGISPKRARGIAILGQATIEGVLLMCRSERSVAPLESALPELLHLIESATPAGTKAARSPREKRARVLSRTARIA